MNSQSNNTFIPLIQEELKHFKLLDKELSSTYLSEYDVIGFDIDHTISLYNNNNMLYALYDSFSRYLIFNKNYPQSLNFESNKDFIYSLSRNDVLLDINNGKALLLDSNNKILKAYHGTHQMTDNEIDSLYLNHFYPDFIYGIHFKENKYYFSKNNFELEIIPLFLLCVQLFDEKKTPAEVNSYKIIQEHIFESIFFNFSLNDTHANCNESGYFYKTLFDDAKKYFFTDYNAKHMLTKLREKGKKIFFATNSYWTYADFVLKNTIGNDYMDYFDLGFYYSKKPGFFSEDLNESKCMFYDKTPVYAITNDIYERINQGEKKLIGGSYKLVEDYFKRVLSKASIKCLFAGDDLYNDCCVSAKLNGWDSVYIYDNIQTGYIGSKLPSSFGSGWNIDKDNNIKNEERKDVKFDLLQKYPKLILSNVEGIIAFLN